jgi:hypothetical protein
MMPFRIPGVPLGGFSNGGKSYKSVKERFLSRKKRSFEMAILEYHDILFAGDKFSIIIDTFL